MGLETYRPIVKIYQNKFNTKAREIINIFLYFNQFIAEKLDRAQ